MKKKLSITLLFLLILASCNKKKVSKDTNITNTVIKERAINVGTVTGMDLLPMFSPNNYFINNHEIPWSLSVVSLNFTKLVQNVDLFASKQYVLLVDTSNLNGLGGTIAWENAVKLPIAAGVLSNDTPKTSIKLNTPWKLSNLLPQTNIIRTLNATLWETNANGDFLENVMDDLILTIPFSPEFDPLPAGSQTGFTLTNLPDISQLNQMLPNSVDFSVTFQPNPNLTANQLVSGPVYGVGMRFLITCQDGTTRIYKPQNADFNTLFPITSNQAFSVNVKLGSICRMQDVLIQSYVYNSLILTPNSGKNQVITVADYGLNVKIIYSDTDLASLNNYTGNVLLADDLDLRDNTGWRPIINFSGNFDGGGHNITTGANAIFENLSGKVENLTLIPNIATTNASGCIGTLANTTSSILTYSLNIKNIDLLGGVVKSTAATSAAPSYFGTGGLIGCVFIPTIFDNITIDGTETSANRNVGGLIGKITSTATLVQLNNVINKSDISGLGDVGGLIGSTDAAIKITNSSCQDATIQSTGIGSNQATTYGNAAGLVGFSSKNVVITNSYNNCTVNSAAPNAAGLVAYNTSSITNAVSITSSYNTGNVSGYMGAIGGLGGRIANSIITFSYNTGDITNTALALSYYAVGGILGSVDVLSTITSTYSTGNLTGARHVGGIVGAGKIVLKDSWAAGTITGDLEIGGLIGLIWRSSTISNCYSIATVPNGDPISGLPNLGTFTNIYFLNAASTSNTNAIKWMAVPSVLPAGFLASAWSLAANTTGVNQGYPYLLNMPLNNGQQ